METVPMTMVGGLSVLINKTLLISFLLWVRINSKSPLGLPKNTDSIQAKKHTRFLKSITPSVARFKDSFHVSTPGGLFSLSCSTSKINSEDVR